jgi:hypothetical protein
MKSKEWIQTPYTHSGQVAKSRTGSGDLKHNATRKEKMTPVTRFSPTSADEALDAIPASTKTHPKLGVKMPMSSGYVGDGATVKAPKSGEMTTSPAVDALPKKWHRRGYDMTVPATLDGNKRR